MISMTFESKLKATPSQLWQWITSVNGFSTELSPYIKMQFPERIQTLEQVEIKMGEPLAKARILFMGFLPLGTANIHIVKLETNKGFVEESPMGALKYWKHERKIETVPGETDSSVLVDILTFDPPYARMMTEIGIRLLFKHRHQKLRKIFR